MEEGEFNSDKEMVEIKKGKIEVECKVGKILVMELEVGVNEEVAKDGIVGT